MGKVRVLPSDLVNQIAAGEVVERPASIVKELVENALDAQATQIRVAIREGGIAWISVSDDGTGMSGEDALLAFERHATSKLETAGDLARVTSLGFRGEALPSIASVAAVRMRTRCAGDALGTELAGDGAGIVRSAPVACLEGTTIEVAELFGRVPARRKFLKSALTEASHVVQWLARIALARPDVRFELERDGRRALLWLPTRDARERVIAVLPPGAGDGLLSVDGEIAGLRVTGYVSPTHVLRSGPSDMHVYVNGRPVRDRLLQFAVRDAYRDALPPGRYPVVVLYLQVEPGEVDVNVHPAKWEVRFRDPGAVTGLLRRAIGAAVRVGGSARPLASYVPSTDSGAGLASDFSLADGFFASAQPFDTPGSPAVSDAPGRPDDRDDARPVRRHQRRRKRRSSSPRSSVDRIGRPCGQFGNQTVSSSAASNAATSRASSRSPLRTAAWQAEDASRSWSARSRPSRVSLCAGSASERAVSASTSGQRVPRRSASNAGSERRLA